MQHDPPETAELLAFVAVIDNGSIAAAADELGLPRATISRRLARLEERLATRLIRRTTRQLALTDAGRELDPHARRIVEAVQQAAKSLQLADGAPRGLLRVSAPPGPAGLFDDVLVEFMARYPHVQLEVERSTRQVDLVAGGFDVALRATSHLHPGLVARRLATVSVGVVAAPSYLARQGTPRDPADLADHAALVGYDRGERPSTHWPLLDGGSVRVNARMASNDLGLLGRAAAAGEGLALLPAPLCAAAIADGSLRPILPMVGALSQLALVYAEKAHLAPAVRAFVDHVASRLPTQWPTSSGQAP